MEPTAREVIAASTGAGVFLALLWMRMPPGIGGVAGLVSYVGVRTLLPSGAGRRDREAERVRTFLDRCHGEAQSLRRLSRSRDMPRGEFQRAVEDLAEAAQKLVQCFEESPARVAVAATFPDKLESLRDMVEGYVSLSAYREETAVADEALRRAERVIPVATGQLRELLGRLLQEDVVRLSSNARVYEELMDFEV